MRLQARDKKLLENLYRFGALTTSQVRRLSFDGIAHSTVLRRLRKLESKKIILRLSGLEDGLLCWCLTNEGAEQVGLDRPTEYRNKNLLRHTTTLADVRLALETTGLGEKWTSEMELRREMYDPKGYQDKDKIIPDGLFVAQVFGQTQMIALELEINLKSRSRYQDLFRQYSRKNTIGLIWYVVDSTPLRDSLLRIWEMTDKYSGAPKFRVSLLDDLISDPRKTKLYGDSESILVEKVFDLKLLSSDDHEGAHPLSNKSSESLSSSTKTEFTEKSTA